ncbi:MAG: hypothetical protein JW820_19700 [Spirochaetales bacterium]|nr:hypothetical protein [Spirochaetales bacterium]
MRGRVLFMVLLAALLRTAPPASPEEPRLFEGAAAWEHPEDWHPAERDLLFNDRRAGGFQSRSFHFTGYLNDGIHLEISLFRWEYGLFGGWGLQVLVAEPGREPCAFEERIPEGDMEVAAERFHIRFGENLLQGSRGRYTVSLRLRELRCDLYFRSLVPPWIPGDGYAAMDRNGTAYVRYGVSVPVGWVEGSLSLQDRTLPVRGPGYADRGLIAAPINRMSSPTCAFRGFSGDGGEGSVSIISLLHYQTHPEYGSSAIPVVLFIEGRRWVLASRKVSLTAAEWVEEPHLPVAYPRRLEVEAIGEGYGASTSAGSAAGGEVVAGPVRLEGAFVGTSLYHYSDVFQKIPALFRDLVDLFLDRPIIFKLLGRFEGTITYPDGTRQQVRLPGHAEYTVVQ